MCLPTYYHKFIEWYSTFYLKEDGVVVVWSTKPPKTSHRRYSWTNQTDQEGPPVVGLGVSFPFPGNFGDLSESSEMSDIIIFIIPPPPPLCQGAA